MTDKVFDLDSAFISVDSQEKGAEFEVISDAGEKTGFFITLAGPDSKRRKTAKSRLMDYFIQKQASAALAGQPKNRKQRRAEAAGLAQDVSTGPAFDELQLDDAVAATISWRFPEGKTGPECTPENVREIYARHPTLLEQVLEKAEDLDLFSKS